MHFQPLWNGRYDCIEIAVRRYVKTECDQNEIYLIWNVTKIDKEW